MHNFYVLIRVSLQTIHFPWNGSAKSHHIYMDLMILTRHEYSLTLKEDFCLFPGRGTMTGFNALYFVLYFHEVTQLGTFYVINSMTYNLFVPVLYHC